MGKILKRVNGIQHIGVGNADLEGTWKWYRKFFGTDISMFDSVAEAPLMNVYTKGKPINKHAAMILNLQGGCAMELVEPKSFKARKPDFIPQLGDIGIYITQIKVKNVKASYDFYINNEAKVLGEISKTPDGRETFFVEDPNGLIFQIVPGSQWFTNTGHHSGGVSGCSIGVTNIEKSVKFWALLGYDKIVFDETAVFGDWHGLPGGNERLHRVLLEQSQPNGGGFAEVMGTTTVELFQSLDREPRKIYKGRMWGDTGFVHVGMDVKNMHDLGDILAKNGHGFTCDSSSGLHMGKTRVHCTYIEDPDGTLIELIEVYKIPIMEKWGIFLDVHKRDPLKPLPRFMLKSMRFNRRKD